MAKKALIFAPFGNWIVHTQLDCVLGAALKNRGCEVKVLACDGIFDSCYIVGQQPDPLKCQTCQNTSGEWFAKFGLEVVQMRSLLQADDWERASSWAAAVPLEELDHEASFFDGHPVARWMRPATHSLLRTGTIDFTDPASIASARKLLIHGALICRAVSRCLDVFPADISTCYSGSNSYYRVFFELMRASGAHPLVHERGSVDGSFFIATGIPTYELSIRKPADWAAWQDVPLSEEQLQTVVDSYTNRAEGKNTNFQVIHQFRTEGSRIKHRLRIPGDKKIVLAMCSGDWEFGMFSSFGGLSVLWKRQFDWLEDTARICRENGWLFIIRQHPLGAGKKTYPRATAFLSEMLREHPWMGDHVRMIMPAENLSSYDLFEIADVVVAQFSRTVAEAYARGVPAVCVTNNTLAHMGIPVVQSREEYPEVLATMMAKSPCLDTEALRLAYRWSNFRFFVLGSSLLDTVRIKNIYEPDFRREGPEEIQPGTDPRLDEICEHLLHRTPLYPPPATLPSTEAETAWIDRHRAGLLEQRLARRASLQDEAEPEVLVLSLNTAPKRWRSRHRHISHLTIELDASGGFGHAAAELSRHLSGSAAPFVHIHASGVRLDESAISRGMDALVHPDHAAKLGVLFGCYAVDSAGIIGPEWNTATFPPDAADLPPSTLKPLAAPLVSFGLVLWRKEKLLAWLEETAAAVGENDDKWVPSMMRSWLDPDAFFNLGEPAVFLDPLPAAADSVSSDPRSRFQVFGRTSKIRQESAEAAIEAKDHAAAHTLILDQFAAGQGGISSWQLLQRALPEAATRKAFNPVSKSPGAASSGGLRFLQLHTFYPAYLAQLHASQPGLFQLSYQDQLAAILADGFGAAHMWAPVLQGQGHEAMLVIGNNVVSQFQWASENLPALKMKKKSAWMHEIALQQVEQFDPDVLYLGDPVSFDMSFVSRLKKRPKWVVGWRAAPSPETVDWSGMDLMLSHLPPCLREAKGRGVLETMEFYPGFPRWVADAVADTASEYDLVFCGQWSDAHEKRNNLLAKLAKAALGKDQPFSFGLFLECADPSSLPDAVRKLNQGGRWGMEMYRTLRKGRVALNAEINMGRGHAGNMRLFEATGCGVCTLTEHHSNISRYFEPDKEVVTFKGADDCLAKLRQLIAERDKRDAIAAAGQQRCLGEHAIERRMELLAALLKRPATGPAAWLRRTLHRFQH